MAGININNFSSKQLEELKNAGFNQVSNADVRFIRAKENASTNRTSDENSVKYTISDDASEVNEAEQEVKDAEEKGTDLKSILNNLISKCSDKNSEMAKLDEEMQKFVVTMEDLGMQADEVVNETSQQIYESNAEMQAKMEELEQKKAEYEELLDIAKSSTDEAEANEATEKAEALGAEITQDSLALDDLSAKTKSQIQEKAVQKATLLGKSMEDVKNMAQENANDAINANEYADVTIEKGIEASTISTRKEAKEAGFKRATPLAGVLSVFDFAKIGNVKEANEMGDNAIITGSELGNSSKSVAQTINTIGSQFGMNFATTSAINDIANKEYADTLKLGDLTDLDDAKGPIDKLKAVDKNSEIKSEIVNDAKEQNGVDLDDEKARKIKQGVISNINPISTIFDEIATH